MNILRVVQARLNVRVAKSGECEGPYLTPFSLCFLTVRRWITDAFWGMSTRAPRNLVSIELLVALAHMYHLSLGPQNTQGAYSDGFGLDIFGLEGIDLEGIDLMHLDLVSWEFTDFVTAFANPSNRPDWDGPHDVSEEKFLQLHHHLRHFSPGATLMPAGGFVFSPDRQAAKIHYFNEKYKTMSVLHLEERLLSLTVTILLDCGTFFLFVVGDKGVPVTNDGCHDSQAWNRIGIDPWTSGKQAGLDHFLVSLSMLLEAWHSSWNITLDSLDNILRFKASILPAFLNA